MKISKKLLTAIIAIAIIATLGINALAATYSSPAEAYAALSKTSVEEAVALRHSSNKTFGTLAEEAGFKQEFEAAMQELHKEKLAEMVATGQITQEEADEFINAMEACDGNDALGQKMFKGSFGIGNREGQGQVRRNYNNNGQRNGRGNDGFGSGRNRQAFTNNNCTSCTNCNPELSTEEVPQEATTTPAN